jgi:hypothetical protein
MYLLAAWYFVLLAGGTVGAMIGLSFSESAFAPSMVLGMMASGHTAYRHLPFLFGMQEDRGEVGLEAEPGLGSTCATGGSPSLRRLAEATEQVSHSARAIVQFRSDKARARDENPSEGPGPVRLSG